MFFNLKRTYNLVRVSDSIFSFQYQISLLIKEAIDAEKVKPKDLENVSKKFSVYIPYWA